MKQFVKKTNEVDYKRLYEETLVELKKLKNTQKQHVSSYHSNSKRGSDNGYCSKCGLGLIVAVTNGFDIHTGERNTEFRCPSGLCEHTNVPHEYDYGQGFFGTLFSDVKCLKCRRIDSDF